MIEWLTDKVLVRVGRQQAPVLIADVTEPTFLIQGVYSNALGQPTVVEWMAVTGLPGEPRVEGHDRRPQRAKVGPDMVNTAQVRRHRERCRTSYPPRSTRPVATWRHAAQL